MEEGIKTASADKTGVYITDIRTETILKFGVLISEKVQNHLKLA